MALCVAWLLPYSCIYTMAIKLAIAIVYYQQGTMQWFDCDV